MAVNEAYTDAISYEEALDRLETVADAQNLAYRGADCEDSNLLAQQYQPERYDESVLDDVGVMVPITEAIGHTSTYTISASTSTPRYDTSAVHGFAICAEATTNASFLNPVKFSILDAQVLELWDDQESFIRHGSAHDRTLDKVCIETKPGVYLPRTRDSKLDTIVRTEDVKLIANQDDEASHPHAGYILVSKPVPQYTNHRPAGSDLRSGQVIVWARDVVEPKHVIALASLGIGRIEVSAVDKLPERDTSERKPHVAVLSIGSDLVDVTGSDYYRDSISENAAPITPDSTGPYLTSSLRYSGLAQDADYMGVVPDDAEQVFQVISHSLSSGDLEVLIASGETSNGQFNLVREVIETRLSATIIFHGARVRPGLPILFALIPCPRSPQTRDNESKQQRTVAFFGLSGDPIAVAAEFRFFIVPYLTMLRFRCCERPSRKAVLTKEQSFRKLSKMHRVVQEQEKDIVPVCEKPTDMTCFWMARRVRESDPKDGKKAEVKLHILEDQALYKVKTMLSANCWAIAPEGTTSFREHDAVLVSSLM